VVIAAGPLKGMLCFKNGYFANDDEVHCDFLLQALL
jgi:hypothetical protein